MSGNQIRKHTVEGKDDYFMIYKHVNGAATRMGRPVGRVRVKY